MREPQFWWRAGAGTGRLLAPLGLVYGAVAAARMRLAGHRVGVPVICIGNLTVGGAGKTPTALAVAKLLLAAHQRPFFLSRGYGGSLAGPIEVKPSAHRAAEVGDEPLLLAALARTIVARKRPPGAAMAIRSGAGIVIMDDGFQNPSLVKDLAIVVVDGRRGVGNARVIPAGPLRAPLRSQLAHAHALLVIGGSSEAWAGATPAVVAAKQRGIALFHGRLEPDRDTVATLGGRKVLAFTGIADPKKFFATLAEAGIEIGEQASFPDHHRYTPREAEQLMARAQAGRMMLLTTEKDLARLTGDAPVAGLAARARALPVRLVVEEMDAFRNLILSVVRR